MHFNARRLLWAPSNARHLLAAAREADHDRGAGAPAQRLGRTITVPAGRWVAVDGHHLPSGGGSEDRNISDAAGKSNRIKKELLMHKICLAQIASEKCKGNGN